ncbi:MAG: sigma 54-interacting transcriptional regulator [Firmicutes bacterium]|nr:sigma 54-interacting transcriptional regulator [Bacillota bacterium]
MDISNRFEMFAEAIPGLMVIDTDGNLVYINEQCADYIKCDREKARGQFVTDVFPPSCMHEMLKGNKKYNVCFYFEDGRMSVSSQVQLREEGKVVGVLEYDTVQDLNGLDEMFMKYSESLRQEADYYREQVRAFQSTKYSIKNILGSSKKTQELKHQIELAATMQSTVLIFGETGTGKELVAHSIHNLSDRAFGPFVSVNAAGMPESLIESELFGYEDGAFTGAKRGGKRGRFELANKGTLFLDEVNQMPLSLQPKLLRALQEGEIEKIGSEEITKVDARIIAATNRDLYEMVQDNTFRDDLYYRLNVFPIIVPPLRERKSDIPELVRAKVEELNLERGKKITRIDPEVFRTLKSYDWPGNIRELYNRVEAAMNYAEGDTLYQEYFKFRADNSRVNIDELHSEENPIEAIKKEAERKLINETLIRFDHNKTKAAEFLKISRPLLYQKMRRLGIKV